MDEINHPPHYCRGIEAYEVIKAYDLGFELGNVLKYVLRCQYKGTMEKDLRKARWYLDRAIDQC
jgi:hypothetical protein